MKIWEENILRMKIKANEIDLKDAEQTKAEQTILFCFFEATIFNFAVENDAGKPVETFCINLVGSNFHT